MFAYENGVAIKVGDSVLFEHGQTQGVVGLIVQSSSEMADIGVQEQGVMLLSAPFGRIYLTTDVLRADPLQLVSRG